MIEVKSPVQRATGGPIFHNKWTCSTGTVLCISGLLLCNAITRADYDFKRRPLHLPPQLLRTPRRLQRIAALPRIQPLQPVCHPSIVIALTSPNFTNAASTSDSTTATDSTSATSATDSSSSATDASSTATDSVSATGSTLTETTASTATSTSASSDASSTASSASETSSSSSVSSVESSQTSTDTSGVAISVASTTVVVQSTSVRPTSTKTVSASPTVTPTGNAAMAGARVEGALVTVVAALLTLGCVW